MAVDISIGIISRRILMVFSLALFGVLARKTGVFRQEAKDSIVDIMLYMTLPPLVFVSMTTEISWERLLSGISLPFLSLSVIVLMFLLAHLLGKLNLISDRRKSTFALLCAMPNAGFIGFPVVLAVLGEAGFAYAVLYDLGVTISFCSIAILVLQGGPVRKESWLSLLNPALVVAVLAVFFNWGQVQIPEVITVPLQIMGSATVPLAMLIMGFLLSGLKVNWGMLDRDLVLVCVCKLLLSPLLAYVLMLPFDLDPMVRIVALMQAAMPSMASTPVLVEKYGGDGDFAVTAVFVTTLLSMVTIPLIFL
ncbi:MAG: AEC family transporter [Limnochordia bacterium]|jgi:predicted permease